MINRVVVVWYTHTCFYWFERNLTQYVIGRDFISYSHKYIHNQMFEDTKGANRNRKSKDRQHNGLNKIDKGTNNDLQNTKQKTQNRPSWTTLKPGDVLRCSGRINSSCYTCDTHLIERVVAFGREGYMLSLYVLQYTSDVRSNSNDRRTKLENIFS